MTASDSTHMRPINFLEWWAPRSDCIAHSCQVRGPAPAPAGDYAQRPLDTKLLLKEKLASELPCLPQAPKGTTIIVLLSSEPY